MPNLRIVLSLITRDNDYQCEQAAAGEEAARRLGVDLQLIFAENALRSGQTPAEMTLIAPTSYPPIERLTRVHFERRVS